MTSNTPHPDTTPTRQLALTQRHSMILLAGLAEIAVKDPTVEIGHFSYYPCPPSDSIHKVWIWTRADSLAGWYAAGVQIEDMQVQPGSVGDDYRTVRATATYSGLAFQLCWTETPAHRRQTTTAAGQ